MEPKGYYLYFRRIVMKITITIEMDEKEIKNIETNKTEKESEKCYSQYARFFDETSYKWTKNKRDNKDIIEYVETYANEVLKARYIPEAEIDGFLYLNEVYNWLGLSRTEAGQVVGWKYNPKNPIGDNRVDIDIIECERSYDGVFLLDFNVDGVII